MHVHNRKEWKFSREQQFFFRVDLAIPAASHTNFLRHFLSDSWRCWCFSARKISHRDFSLQHKNFQIKTSTKIIFGDIKLENFPAPKAEPFLKNISPHIFLLAAKSEKKETKLSWSETFKWNISWSIMIRKRIRFLSSLQSPSIHDGKCVENSEVSWRKTIVFECVPRCIQRLTKGLFIIVQGNNFSDRDKARQKVLCGARNSLLELFFLDFAFELVSPRWCFRETKRKHADTGRRERLILTLLQNNTYQHHGWSSRRASAEESKKGSVPRAFRRIKWVAIASEDGFVNRVGWREGRIVISWWGNVWWSFSVRLSFFFFRSIFFFSSRQQKCFAAWSSSASKFTFSFSPRSRLF